MKFYLCFVVLTFATSIGLAAPFQNLDFEQYSGLVPGWMFQNDLVLTGDGSKILTRLPLDYGVNDPFSPSPPFATMFSRNHKPFGFPAETGNYLLGLYPSLDGSGFYPWFVRQTGEIPSDAKSMFFDLGGAQVSLKLNGTEVPLEFFSRSGALLAGWGFADVSSFAGKTVTMEFTAPGSLEDFLSLIAPGASQPYTLLDNIQFSPSSIPTIPEPATLILLVAGGFLSVSCNRKGSPWY